MRGSAGLPLGLAHPIPGPHPRPGLAPTPQGGLSPSAFPGKRLRLSHPSLARLGEWRAVLSPALPTRPGPALTHLITHLQPHLATLGPI